MKKENKFEKLEIVLKGSPDVEKYNEEILACIKEINERTQHRLILPVLDGYADANEYKINLFRAKDQALILTKAIELRNVELPNEKRIILMQEILNLISEGLHIHEQYEHNKKIISPITEVFKLPSEEIIKDSYLHYHYWILLIKSILIKKIRDEAIFYDLNSEKIITPENDKEGISGLWADMKIDIRAPLNIKIKWKGAQNKLAELIHELESKGWIEAITDGNRWEISNSIYDLFDLSDRKKEGSDQRKSFYEEIKKYRRDENYVHTNKKRKENSFEGIKPVKAQKGKSIAK